MHPRVLKGPLEDLSKSLMLIRNKAGSDGNRSEGWKNVLEGWGGEKMTGVSQKAVGSLA